MDVTEETLTLPLLKHFEQLSISGFDFFVLPLWILKETGQIQYDSALNRLICVVHWGVVDSSNENQAVMLQLLAPVSAPIFNKPTLCWGFHDISLHSQSYQKEKVEWEK